MAWSDRMLRPATALAALCLSLLGAAAAAPPELAAPSALHAAIEATAAARAPYAFDLDINSSKLNWRAHFDPRSTPHLRLIEPQLAALGHDQRRAFDDASRRMQGLSWCASAEIGRIANVSVLRDDAVSTAYSFQPTRDSLGGEGARPFAGQLRGELTLLKADADIVRIHIFAPRPFSPAILVNVTRMDMVISCAAAPNHRRFASEAVTEIAGSALGQAFNERTVQRTHDLAPAP
jgi:hypothetical protein